MLKSKAKFNENDQPIIVLCQQQRHFQFSEKPQKKKIRQKITKQKKGRKTIKR